MKITANQFQALLNVAERYDPYFDESEDTEEFLSLEDWLKARPGDTHCQQVLAQLMQAGAEVLEVAANAIQRDGYDEEDPLREPDAVLDGIDDNAGKHIQEGQHRQSFSKKQTLFSAIGLGIMHAGLDTESLQNHDMRLLVRHQAYCEALQMSIHDQAFRGVIEDLQKQRRQALPHLWHNNPEHAPYTVNPNTNSASRLLRTSSERLLSQARILANEPTLQINAEQSDIDILKQSKAEIQEQQKKSDGTEDKINVPATREIRAFARLIKRAVIERDEARQASEHEPQDIETVLLETIRDVYEKNKKHEKSLFDLLYKSYKRKKFGRKKPLTSDMRWWLYLALHKGQKANTDDPKTFPDRAACTEYLVTFLSHLEYVTESILLPGPGAPIAEGAESPSLLDGRYIALIQHIEDECIAWGEGQGEALRMDENFDEEIDAETLAEMAADCDTESERSQHRLGAQRADEPQPFNDDPDRQPKGKNSSLSM